MFDPEHIISSKTSKENNHLVTLGASRFLLIKFCPYYVTLELPNEEFFVFGNKNAKENLISIFNTDFITRKIVNNFKHHAFLLQSS